MNSSDSDCDSQSSVDHFWKQLLHQQTINQKKNFKPPNLNNSSEEQHQNCVKLIQRLSLKSFEQLHSQPQSTSRYMQTLSNPISQSPKNVKIQISPIQNNNMEVNDDSLSEDFKYEKWPIERQKKNRKKKYKALKLRLISPESPLTIFSTLYKNVPIELIEKSYNNYTVFSASIEIEGQVYTGNHISKIQAKQKACQNFLHKMLEKKLRDQCQQEESFNKFKTNDANIHGTNQDLPQDDFPWTHFASLAMYNSAMSRINASNNTYKESNSNMSNKFKDTKQFPEDPRNYNPVQLLYYMIPRVQFTIHTVCFHRPQIFDVKCEIKNEKFNGRGSSKKIAKRECAIAVIKHFWNFDFHTMMNHY